MIMGVKFAKIVLILSRAVQGKSAAITRLFVILNHSHANHAHCRVRVVLKVLAVEICIVMKKLRFAQTVLFLTKVVQIRNVATRTQFVIMCLKHVNHAHLLE